MVTTYTLTHLRNIVYSWYVNTTLTYVHLQPSNHTQIYERESKSNALFFSTGIITDTGTCIIPQNEVAFLWIPSLPLNIVTVSLNSSVPSCLSSLWSNERGFNRQTLCQ